MAIRNSRTYLEGVGLCNLGASRMELLETLKYQVNKWMAINDKTEGVFGLAPTAPHRATHRAPQVWRPNRPPRVRRGVAP